MAVLGLRFCARAFSSCGKRGPLLIVVHGSLTITASPAAEHRLQTRRLSNCGSRAQPLRGTWDPPRPGPEPVSPALAGRLPTTAPPWKPHSLPFHFVDSLLRCADRITYEKWRFLGFSKLPIWNPWRCGVAVFNICPKGCWAAMSCLRPHS